MEGKKMLLLKGGEVVGIDKISQKDLFIVDGKIVEGGEKVASYREIDCRGKYILPGLIDVHVHFREPGATHKEDFGTGSAAAVCGGVTTVFDMPNNTPPTTSGELVEAKRKIIDGRSHVNYGLYIGFNGDNIEEINQAKNVAGVKVYVANSTGNMGVNKKTLETLFEKSNKLIVAHAEDEEMIAENLEKYKDRLEEKGIHSKIRDNKSAYTAVKFVCELAKKYGARLHIAHLSTEEELNLVSGYRQYGVTCEVTPHHLFLNEDDYTKWGNFIKVNPPVRSGKDVFAMWKGLKNGLIDVIATDHAPHTIEEKSGVYSKVPSGVPGVEMMLPLLLNVVNDDGLSLCDIVKFCAGNPAKIFNLKNKGRAQVGYDADLVVVDMEKIAMVKRENIRSKCGWSPYEGMNLKGWPIVTIANGEIAYDGGLIPGKKGGKEILF